MKNILEFNGIVYDEVILQSAYIESVSVTFRVDLEELDQKEGISQFTNFLNNPEIFSNFSNYSISNDKRGLLDVTISGTVCRLFSLCVNNILRIYTQIHACAHQLLLRIHYNFVVVLLLALVTVWMAAAWYYTIIIIIVKHFDVSSYISQCQPPFVGDGLSCTLDSDGDGYPDQPLDSNSCSESPTPPAYCIVVRKLPLNS